MKFFSSLFVFVLFLFVGCTTNGQRAVTAKSDDGAEAVVPIKALIVDGQNKWHPAWPKTTQMIKQYLEETGLFTVDIQRTKYLLAGEQEKDWPLKDGKTYVNLKQGKTDPDFAPDFSKYQLVIINSGNGAAAWPGETEVAFEKFMAEGGGLLVVHSADNCFPHWKAFNRMTGLGGWGGRNEKDGPYVYLNDKEELVRDTSKGKGGGHGPQHNFELVVRHDHPITAGLPTAWMHSRDELYQRLRGPAENMTVLLTAYAEKEFKGSQRHEPMVMVINYKQGRTCHIALGHADYSFECVGMITLIKRGCEWAATGNVTQTDVPEDFPGRDSPSVRKFKMANHEAATN